MDESILLERTNVNSFCTESTAWGSYISYDGSPAFYEIVNLLSRDYVSYEIVNFTELENELSELIDMDVLIFDKSSKSWRPAKDGKQYQWYTRFENNSEIDFIEVSRRILDTTKLFEGFLSNSINLHPLELNDRIARGKEELFNSEPNSLILSEACMEVANQVRDKVQISEINEQIVKTFTEKPKIQTDENIDQKLNTIFKELNNIKENLGSNKSSTASELEEYKKKMTTLETEIESQNTNYLTLHKFKASLEDKIETLSDENISLKDQIIKLKQYKNGNLMNMEMVFKAMFPNYNITSRFIELVTTNLDAKLYLQEMRKIYDDFFKYKKEADYIENLRKLDGYKTWYTTDVTKEAIDIKAMGAANPANDAAIGWKGGLKKTEETLINQIFISSSIQYGNRKLFLYFGSLNDESITNKIENFDPPEERKDYL